MTRPKIIEVLNAAEGRALAISPIASKLDLGKTLSLEAFLGRIDGVRTKLTTSTNLDAEADRARTELVEAANELADFSARLLKAIQAQFGTDSDEYAMAGGTRPRDRRRPARREDDAAGATGQSPESKA